MFRKFKPLPVDSRGQELAVHGPVNFPIKSYEEDVYADPVKWHWHADWEIIENVRGVMRVQKSVCNSRPCVCELGEHSACEMVLEPGQTVILGPGVIHEIIGEEPGSTLHSAVFHPRLMGGVDTVIWQKYVQPLQRIGAISLIEKIPWQKEIIRLFRDCWQIMFHKEVGYEILVRERLTQIAFILYSELDLTEGRVSPQEQRNSQRIKAMLRFIQENYAENITLAQIAASAAISESECLRCFRHTINTTPGRYLKEYRLQQAAALLVSTKEKAGDIGAACGFPDAAYFTKLFREAKGCTPVEYRKRQQYS